MEKIASTEDMRTLVSCMNKQVLDGYTGNFKITGKGIYSFENDRHYKPEEVHVVNFFRFGGTSGLADNSILYVIEINDGTKGTLTDAYRPYADPHIAKFMKQVEDISKKQPH